MMDDCWGTSIDGAGRQLLGGLTVGFWSTNGWIGVTLQVALTLKWVSSRSNLPPHLGHAFFFRGLGFFLAIVVWDKRCS